jgi:hypothetical protein
VLISYFSLKQSGYYFFGLFGANCGICDVGILSLRGYHMWYIGGIHFRLIQHLIFVMR